LDDGGARLAQSDQPSVTVLLAVGLATAAAEFAGMTLRRAPSWQARVEDRWGRSLGGAGYRVRHILPEAVARPTENQAAAGLDDSLPLITNLTPALHLVS
jgi:hypothetical protein